MTTTETTRQLITGFESGTLPKEQWSHEAHFVMALWYGYHQPIPRAIHSIKEGIKKYNISVGGVNDADNGYHETITVCYTRLVFQYLSMSDKNDFDQLLSGLYALPILKKDYLLNFYTKNHLMSREARAKWVIPDKRQFLTLEML